MKVTLVSGFAGGAFHHAEQLEALGLLSKFITSLPTARGLRIPQSKVLLNVIPEVIARLPLKIPWVRAWYPWEYFKALAFGAWAKRHIGGENIVVAFSMFGLEALRQARANGAVTIIERGSSHILCQRRLVEKEHVQWGYSDRRVLYQRGIERQLREYEEADYVLVNSQFAWDSFIAEGFPARRLLRAPLGVDLTRFRPQEKRDDVFRIMCVGGGLRKGTHYLLEAVKQLVLPKSEVVWIGAGSPEENPFWRQYVGQFKVIGKVPNEGLFHHYSQASVVVVPSVEDGWCVVVGEAMACGVPVICTANTGASEMVRDGLDGFVVPIRDVEALKAKLLYLYEHEDERIVMGRSALGRAQSYTWEHYGRSLQAEYKRVIWGRSANASQRGTGFCAIPSEE